MKLGQSDKLWSVLARDKEWHKSPKLWILANSLEAATRKANRWLKREGYGKFQIVKIKDRGTIDAF